MYKGAKYNLANSTSAVEARKWMSSYPSTHQSQMLHRYYCFLDHCLDLLVDNSWHAGPPIENGAMAGWGMTHYHHMVAMWCSPQWVDLLQLAAPHAIGHACVSDDHPNNSLFPLHGHINEHGSIVHFYHNFF